MSKKVVLEFKRAKVSDLEPGSFFSLAENDVVHYEKLDETSYLLPQTRDGMCYAVKTGQIEEFDPDKEVIVLKTTVNV